MKKKNSTNNRKKLEFVGRCPHKNRDKKVDIKLDNPLKADIKLWICKDCLKEIYKHRNTMKYYDKKDYTKGGGVE